MKSKYTEVENLSMRAHNIFPGIGLKDEAETGVYGSSAVKEEDERCMNTCTQTRSAHSTQTESQPLASGVCTSCCSPDLKAS